MLHLCILQDNSVPAVLTSLMAQQLEAVADVWLLNMLLLRRDLCCPPHLHEISAKLCMLNCIMPGIRLPRSKQASRRSPLLCTHADR